MCPRKTFAKENVAIHHIMRKDVVCPAYIPTKYFANGLTVNVENYCKMFNAKENQMCLSINPTIHDNCVEMDSNLTAQKLKKVIKDFSDCPRENNRSIKRIYRY